MPSRRRVLAICAGTAGSVLAGCLSNSSDSTPAERSSPSQTASPAAGSSTPTVPAPDVTTPAPGECEAASRPHPETADGLPDPKPYPDKPAAIEKAPVRAFLEAYETAYRYNRRLAEITSTGNCLRYLDMSVDESTVTSVENGVTGEVVTRGSFTGGTCPGTTATETPTPLPHADLAFESAQYYVTERFLLRNGVTVECWG